MRIAVLISPDKSVTTNQQKNGPNFQMKQSGNLWIDNDQNLFRNLGIILQVNREDDDCLVYFLERRKTFTLLSLYIYLCT